MRFLILVLSWFVLANFELIAEGDAEAEKLQAQAISLLQKNEKVKALKMLESAFEKTTNTEALREISVLILAASPLSYPKRESYLQYLIKFNAEHSDAWMWFKEMGDRAFEKGKLDEAEDWYLRALPSAQDPNLIRYKLGWVCWNLKRKVEALQTFVDIYSKTEPSMQEQLIKDLTKLWWEIGALPPSAFESVLSLPEEARRSLLTRLFDAPPAVLDPGPELAAQLLQLKEDPRTKDFYNEGIQKIVKLKNAPCFAFNVLLTTEDQFSKDQLLLCLKAKDRPAAPKMISFVERLLSENDEKIDWAYSELLNEMGSTKDAAIFILKIDRVSHYSNAYLEYATQLALKLEKEEFAKVYEAIGLDSFEVLLKFKMNPNLLERLQSVDLGPWISFEEKTYAGKKLPNAFILKKGVWLNQSAAHTNEELRDLFRDLVKNPSSNEERRALEGYKKLQSKVSTKLPSTFSLQFKKKFDEWLRALDQSLDSLKGLRFEIQVLAQAAYQEEIRKNVEAIEAQLDASVLDPKLIELKDNFEEKKTELKSDLRAKYLSQDDAGVVRP